MAKRKRPKKRTFDALPDTPDFRDRAYVATLVEVPQRITIKAYRKYAVPVLDQGSEGACTGFGLATAANYLLRRRRVDPDVNAVSPHMLYTIARKYDEWPGEKYEGSSARGAMKGWHKHGVCSQTSWPKNPRRAGHRLNDARAADARQRPLGAYFRVNHKDIVAMHSALAEVGVLYGTAIVHAGWDDVRSDGIIKFQKRQEGGHAFAIVAYDERGFWIQNSWGKGWGKDGFALICYDDWFDNGTDVWVARLGAPIQFGTDAAVATARSAFALASGGYTYHDLKPHIISIGNDGELRDTGTFGTDAVTVRDIFEVDFPRITASWGKKRLLLYAHGGLVSESAAVQRVADYRAALLDAEVYPLSFIWKSDFWTTLTNILEDALRRRRPEGFLDAAKNFMLDRLDDALEPVARLVGGRAIWSEMKENALRATTRSRGGARIALEHVKKLVAGDNAVALHVAGHSAGSILMAPVVQMLAASSITSGPLKGK